MRKTCINKKTMKKILFFSFVFALPVILAGCGAGEKIGQKAGEKIMEKTIEAQTGQKVDINQSGDNVTIKSEDGKSTISGGGDTKAPDNFPTELIVASDAKIFMSSTSETGSSVSYNTDTDQAALYEKYTTGLADLGWAKDSGIDMGNAKIVNLSKGASKAIITIGDNNSKDKAQKNMVNVTLVEEKAQE